MKLWKKVYLYALVLTTLCINLGFLGMMYAAYEHMLSAEKERCEAEYVILWNNIFSDIQRLEKALPLDAEYFARYVNAYSSYYGSDTMLIGIMGDTVLTEYEGLGELPLQDGIYLCEEAQTTIYVSQDLGKGYEGYRIVMRRTLQDFDAMWERLRPLYLGGGMLLSLGVSCLLAAIVRSVLKPMDQLEWAAKQVQEQKWSVRVSMQGKDELAQLGAQFNAMAETVEKSVEKLKQQSQQKQEFINNLSHEMNTPITSIQGFAEYMQITDISREEQEECLNFISSESRRLKEISTTLLQMVDMQCEERIQMEEFSLLELCEKIELFYQKQYVPKNIKFHMYCGKIHMKGNPVLFESLLRNLISNAGRAVYGKSDAWIELRVSQTEEAIQIQVSDNGCGIAKEHLEQIFEPFYRVDKARSRAHGGSGLGLAFCRKIAEMHQGTITVESELEIGTTFIVTIPFPADEL